MPPYLESDPRIGGLPHEHGEDPVLPPSRLRGHPLRHLALEQQDGAAHERALVEQMEEDG